MKRKIWWQIPGSLPISKKITLQSQHGPVGKNWWTTRFVSVLEDYERMDGSAGQSIVPGTDLGIISGSVLVR